MSNDTYELELGVDEVYVCYDCYLWDIPNSSWIFGGLLVVIVVLYIVYRRKVNRPIFSYRKTPNDQFLPTSKKSVKLNQLSLEKVVVEQKQERKSNENDIVIQKISEYLEDKPVELIQIVCLLVKETNESKEGISPTRIVLNSLMEYPEAFNKYVDSLILTSKADKIDTTITISDRLEVQPSLEKPNQTENIFSFIEIDLLEDKSNGLDKKSKKLDPSMENIDIRAIALCGQAGFARAWSSIPLTSQRQIVQVLPLVLKVGGYLCNETALTVTNNFIGNVAKHNGVLGVALLSGYLSYETMKNIYLWYHGKISGKRVAKNLIDTSSTLIAGAAGGVVGAMVGGVVGPVGTITGGFLGSIAASAACSSMIDKLTQNFFGIPKDIAVENAYRFIGVTTNSKNEEINKSYKNLCLKYHPDKGGSAEDFNKLRASMGLIKVHRGEIY